MVSHFWQSHSKNLAFDGKNTKIPYASVRILEAVLFFAISPNLFAFDITQFANICQQNATLCEIVHTSIRNIGFFGAVCVFFVPNCKKFERYSFLIFAPAFPNIVLYTIQTKQI